MSIPEVQKIWELRNAVMEASMGGFVKEIKLSRDAYLRLSHRLASEFSRHGDITGLEVHQTGKLKTLFGIKITMDEP